MKLHEIRVYTSEGSTQFEETIRTRLRYVEFLQEWRRYIGFKIYVLKISLVEEEDRRSLPESSREGEKENAGQRKSNFDRST